MTKPRGNEPFKLRNSRYKLLVTILYHRALKRPTGNTVETGPSELTRLAGISKNHITVDNLKWLEEMQYIKDVECRYGSVKFTINTNLIMAHNEPKPAAQSVGSPSESALAGGVVISSPSGEPEEEPVPTIKEFVIANKLMKERAKYRLKCECENSVIICSENYTEGYDHYCCGLCRKEYTVSHKKNEGENQWTEDQKQDEEVESQMKEHSAKSSTTSTSQPKLKLKLKRPFTTE